MEGFAGLSLRVERVVQTVAGDPFGLTRSDGLSAPVVHIGAFNGSLMANSECGATTVVTDCSGVNWERQWRS
jgi:hypothetical protein